MTPVLDDLLSDGRLTRLFSTDARHCALQLWVLHIQSGHSIENRVVYGRLLPYNHSSDSWSFSHNNKFDIFGQVKAKVTQLNLHIKSGSCADFLRYLSVGQTLSEISEKLEIGFSDNFKKRFGATALATDTLVYRPVVYLLNRNAYNQRAPSSPHGGAGAFSASITQTNKSELFRLGPDYDAVLTASVVKQLNADTGLDFGGADIIRFGDIELLVFPALDDQDQPLLRGDWVDASSTFVARFNPMQVPHFSSFQFRLCITNDGQVIYAGIATAKPDVENVFVCKFELGDQLREIADSTELEVFGVHDDHPDMSTLCCRWRIEYIREVHFQGRAVGHRVNPVKFDWLEKTVNPPASERVKAALTTKSGNLEFGNAIGGRKADPWVTANRDLVSLFAQLHPQKSEALFFLRWGQSGGEGRLQFVEWFKALLAKYQGHQVAIFDPYFEDVGLDLLLICAAEKADYIVFRSLPKAVKEKCSACGKPDKSPEEGINNLLANCEHNRQRLKRFKLSIYGLKEGRLHDRYILIRGQDGLPVAGFNLSNSFQRATEKFPLLVTPIPSDVLLKVEQYRQDLEAWGETNNPAMRLLFDSTASPTVPRHYEPLSFLEKAKAGDVLSAWTGALSLRGLSGNLLKERMTELELLRDGSLAFFEIGGLLNCLNNQQIGEFTERTQTWDVLGEMLAHSHIEDYDLRDLEPKRDFLDFLVQYLNASFSRALDLADTALALIEPRFFQEPIDARLHSAYRLHHLFHPIKYTALTWPEYYSIKFLWWFAPNALLTIAETQMASVAMEPQSADAMRLSLLSQVASEISLSVQFGVNEVQRDLLVRSSNGLLQWMGLNAIEMELEKPKGLTTVLQVVADFTYSEQVRALGWMVHNAERNPQKAAIYKGLVAALHQALPEAISADQLACLINSMRGHMRELAWTEPWLFQDVVFPLLQNNRANTDDACEIWVQELVGMLEPQLNDHPLLFARAREGQTTNIAAFLFAYSGSEQQRISLKLIRAILNRQQKIIQPPLASTSNWSRWDGALTVSIWILAFTRWAQYHLRERNIIDLELKALSHDARVLAMFRPMDEWRSERGDKQGELAAFLDQVDAILGSSGEPKSEL
jgi:hypothetical protein